ncbi:MAG: chorismate mutase [Treponema sp.]|jgi:chorismate mutase|nr:chorismate mutase [Treponema sp.]
MKLKRKGAKRLVALRGATQCKNEVQDIQTQVAALYDELLCKNRLQEKDLVSVLFSVTPDLTVQNPAAALRQSGRALDLALFAVQEAVVQGSMPRVIRVLIHGYLGERVGIAHVYRNGAEALRPDRADPSSSLHSFS